MSTNSIKLSNLQISVMKVLWQHGKQSVSQTHQILNQHKPIALTTVATLLKRMEEKNIVAFEKQGRQHMYYAVVSEAEVKSSMLGSLLNHLFSGKPDELVHHLVEQDEVSAHDLAKIRELLEQEHSND